MITLAPCCYDGCGNLVDRILLSACTGCEGDFCERHLGHYPMDGKWSPPLCRDCAVQAKLLGFIGPSHPASVGEPSEVEEVTSLNEEVERQRQVAMAQAAIGMKSEEDRGVGLKEAEEVLGLSGPRIRYLCDHDRIPGAYKLGDKAEWRVQRRASRGQGPGKTLPWVMPLSGLLWFQRQVRPPVKPRKAIPQESLAEAS